MKATVLVTRALPEAGLLRLQEACDVTVFAEDRQPTREELMELLPAFDGLLCNIVDAVDAEVLRSGTRLRAVSNFGVGHDHIDLKAATQLGLPVANTPGVLTNATAEMAWALLMAVSRRVVEADAFLRAGKWQGFGPKMLLGTELTGKTLGIVGCGRIGLAVAKRAKAFEMNVVYMNRRRLEADVEREYGLVYADLDTLLRTSDFVSLHLPYSAEAHHVIGAEQLRMMKPTAYLINTARGSVVDEAALAEALAQRSIAGAGLDVFEEEPKVHPGLLGLDNVVLAPHLGSATVETRTKMAELAGDNLLQMLRGERPAALLNPEVYEEKA